MRPKPAFTIIELLVVIAVIVILLSILVPAFGMTKMHKAEILCASNNRLLIKAWLLFQEDNDGNLCGGNTYDNDQWIGPPVDENGNVQTSLSYLATLEDESRGFANGQLWPYLQNHRPYHCPGDILWQRLNHGYRSTSIQGLMNGEQSSSEYCVKKISEIKSPGTKFVFIENVDPRGWNGGSWIMRNPDSDTPGWIDPIAVFHNDNSTFVFADGHIEKHKWLGTGDGETIQWAYFAVIDDPLFRFYKPIQDYSSGEGEDIRWLAKGYIPK